MLPKFLDVVYWAHEHECLIELDQGLNSNFYVTQPGSPIVTSFCAAEARPKYVGNIKKLLCFYVTTTINHFLHNFIQVLWT